MTNQLKIFRHFFLCLLAWAEISVGVADEYPCMETGETHIWTSPLRPSADEQVKFMAVSTDGPLSELFLGDNQGRRTRLQFHRRGGPPWSLISSLDWLDKGDYRVMAGPEWQAYRLPYSQHRRNWHQGKPKNLGACHRSLLFSLDRRVVRCAARGKPKLSFP
jgi:hypothetical protein